MAHVVVGPVAGLWRYPVKSMQGEGLDAVGFAEVVSSAGVADEVVRVPSNVLDRVLDTQPIDIVLTRLRTRPTNRYRGDPEAAITRAFTLANDRQFNIAAAARIAQRADDATLASLLTWTGTISSRHLTGVPAMGGWAATDGDPGTAWVSPFGSAVGSSLTLPTSPTRPLTQLALRQPTSNQLGVITEISVQGNANAQTVAVPPPDDEGVSHLVLNAIAGSSITVTITATNHAVTTDRRYGEPIELPVGISELSADGIVPEALPQQLDTGCRDDLISIDGVPLPVRITGSVADLFADHDAIVSPCTDQAVVLRSGEHIVRSTAGLKSAIDVNRIVLRSADSATTATATAEAEADRRPSPAVRVLSSGRTSRSIRVDACPTGCWIVFGEGFNLGWSASSHGSSLGTQQPVDGGFNGWLLPPSDVPRTIELTWSGQTSVDLGLLITGVGLVLCFVVIARRRRRTDPHVTIL